VIPDGESGDYIPVVQSGKPIETGLKPKYINIWGNTATTNWLLSQLGDSLENPETMTGTGLDIMRRLQKL